MEVITEEYLSIDIIIREVNFVRIRWSQTVSKTFYRPSTEYGLVAADSTREQVLVVSMENCLLAVKIYSDREKLFLKTCDPVDEWRNKNCCLNRFHKSKGEKYIDEEKFLQSHPMFQRDKS